MKVKITNKLRALVGHRIGGVDGRRTYLVSADGSLLAEDGSSEVHPADAAEFARLPSDFNVEAVKAVPAPPPPPSAPVEPSKDATDSASPDADGSAGAPAVEWPKDVNDLTRKEWVDLAHKAGLELTEEDHALKRKSDLVARILELAEPA